MMLKMMDANIGIEAIGTYIPDNYEYNDQYKEKLAYDDSFLRDKLGVLRRSLRKQDENTSDLAFKAVLNLQEKTQLDLEEVDCLILVTQNPDSNIPHTSAVLHDKFKLKSSCACFDISLGCSGYVYGLSVIHSFMSLNGFKKGILVTADPYSKIIDREDKNTFLVFGDAATATLVSSKPKLKLGKFVFGTNGVEREALVSNEGTLYMNGRAVFNFAARTIPKNVEETLLQNNCDLADIDSFVFHQGSKYIVDTITKKLNLNPEKVPYDILDYGNTVSSSIPLILSKSDIFNSGKILLSGFGVGLSWAGTVLFPLGD